MTREEFINWFEVRFALTKNDIYELGQLYDEMIKPHWISVEEELPPYEEQVLAFAKEDPDYEMWWSERYTEDGAKYGEHGQYVIMTDKNGFASMRDENNNPLQVTHWMKITPPVISNSENTGKDLKGGEE